MTVSAFLKQAVNRLETAGISTARLDALVLLEDATGKDRSWLLAHPEYDLKEQSFHLLEEQIARRAQHVPLAQIRQKTEFYGRNFYINAHVLEPRPESETLIDLMKQVIDSRHWTVDSPLQIIDVGTGSGALAITAKLEIPAANVMATDIDQDCLEVARINTGSLHADVSLYEGDLLKPLLQNKNGKIKIEPSTTVLLCNLPYVPDSYRVNRAALNEPRIAIFGGPDGLELYRKLFHQIDLLPAKPRLIFTESLPFQHLGLEQIAFRHKYQQIDHSDLIQVFGWEE